MATCKIMKPDSYLILHKAQRWIKDLNMRPDILNVIEEKVGDVSTYRHRKVLLEHDPIIQTFRPAFDNRTL